MSDKSKAAQLRALYRQLPRLECKGRCQHACGPIGLSREERAIIVRSVGRAPRPRDASLTCSLLTEDGKCSAYAVRPLLCRLYGMVPRMRCPHGCEPEYWLTDEEGFRLMRRALEIGGKDEESAKRVHAQVVKAAESYRDTPQ